MDAMKISVVEAKKKVPTLNAIAKDALTSLMQPLRTGATISADVALEQACTKADMPRQELGGVINVIAGARLGAQFKDSNDVAVLCYEMGKCLYFDGAELSTTKAWVSLATQMGNFSAKYMLENEIIPLGRLKIACLPPTRRPKRPCTRTHMSVHTYTHTRAYTI